MATRLGTPCIEWRGYRDPQGRGRIKRDGRAQLVHRWAYEQEHGPLEPGVEVMHRCDNPPCYRLDHLRAGTHADNMADMRAKGRGRGHLADRTACNHGHLFTPENTGTAPDGYRYCKGCSRETHRRYRARRQAAA